MDYIYGKLNFEVKKVEYKGTTTETTKTTVVTSGEANEISVDVLKVPNKLIVNNEISNETIEFDGSSEEEITIHSYSILNVSWTDLKTLRDSSQLVPGRQYRITDYECTTVQADTRSAGHQFDIIVTADDVDKLNENARAVHSDRDVPILKGITASIATMQGEAGDVLKRAFEWDDNHPEGFIYAWGTNADIDDGDSVNFVRTKSVTPSAGDVVYRDGDYGVVVSIIEEDYFANSKLEAWQLKYCLDNDADRFVWADEVNGKGVIYRMIDEFNNDVSYDFKNIMFKRKITDGVYDEDAGTETWCYTFTGISSEYSTLIDGTALKASEYFSDEGSNLYKNNKIGIYEYKRFEEDGNDKILQQLNNIVFIGEYNEEPYTEEGPSKLVLFSYNNVLGAECYDITFGNYCRNNTFGDNCYSNTFGYGCSNNTFGNYCYSNTFGYGCYNNTFGNYCHGNTFGNNCSGNTFGNYYYHNTFDGGCGTNTFGDDCYGNTFGNNCCFNTFGSRCNTNALGDYCNYNTFGNDCWYLKISDNTASQKKYISVDNGFKGASSANQFDLYDTAILNKDYQVTFSKDADGRYVMTWLDDYDKIEGKYKDNNLDAVWKNLPHNIDGGIW